MDVPKFTLDYYKGQFQDEYATTMRCAYENTGALYDTVRCKRAENRTCNYTNGREFAELFQDAIDAKATEITFFGPATMPENILKGKLRDTGCTALIHDNGTGIAPDKWGRCLNDGSVEKRANGVGNDIGANSTGRNANLGEKCFTSVTISSHEKNERGQILVALEMHIPYTKNGMLRFMLDPDRREWFCIDKCVLKLTKWTPLVASDFDELIKTFFPKKEGCPRETGTIVLMFGVSPVAEDIIRIWCKGLFFEDCGNLPTFKFRRGSRIENTKPVPRLKYFDIVQEEQFKLCQTDGLKWTHKSRMGKPIDESGYQFVAMLVRDNRETPPAGESYVQVFCANQHIPMTDLNLIEKVFVTHVNRTTHWFTHVINENILQTPNGVYRIVILLQDSRDANHLNHTDLLVYQKVEFRIGERRQRKRIRALINNSLYVLLPSISKMPRYAETKNMYEAKKFSLGQGTLDEESTRKRAAVSSPPRLQPKKAKPSNARKNFSSANRKAAMAKYNNRCYNRFCRASLTGDKMEWDHINGYNQDDSEENCGPICVQCHRIKTSFERKHFGNNTSNRTLKEFQDTLHAKLDKVNDWYNAGSDSLSSYLCADMQHWPKEGIAKELIKNAYLSK